MRPDDSKSVQVTKLSNQFGAHHHLHQQDPASSFSSAFSDIQCVKMSCYVVQRCAKDYKTLQKMWPSEGEAWCFSA